ncbi:MAG TPA: protein kinase, partial [Thermoanaerobaculia bacterium]
MSDTRRINERYHLEKKISSKETGSVYRATDTLSAEIVAVKLIDADDLEERRERFQEYARILQSLHHPALPRLLDAGLTAAGSAFLVTEFLQGASLDHLAGEPAVRTLGLLLFAVDGLEALALAGLAHGNLRADNLFVVDGSGGEEVKLLGLGSGVLREPKEATDDFRNDLRDFASLTAEVLGATITAEDGLRDPEALRTFLADATTPAPETARLTSWSSVRQELRRALVGGPGRTLETRRTEAPPPGSGTVRVPLRELRKQMEEQQGAPADELKTRLFRPEDLAPAPPPLPSPLPPLPPPLPATPPPVPAAAAPTPPPPRTVRPGKSKALVLVAGAVLAVLALAAAGGFFVWKLRKPPAPPPPTPPIVVRKPVPVTVQQIPVTPTPTPPPPQVSPQIPPADAAGLARALSSGDPRALRSAVEAIRPEQEAALTRQARKDLARARKILDLDARLARTEKEGRPLEIVRQASLLLAEQPKNARALKARDDAADAVEAEAEAKAQAGPLDAAATRLEQLRDAW